MREDANALLLRLLFVLFRGPGFETSRNEKKSPYSDEDEDDDDELAGFLSVLFGTSSSSVVELDFSSDSFSFSSVCSISCNSSMGST